MSFSVYYRHVIAYDLGHSVCFVSQVRQSFFGSGLKQAGQHTVIRIWARTLAGYVYHSSAILLCMHYCMQKSCQTNFKRLYLKKKLFSKLVNTIHLESNTFISVTQIQLFTSAIFGLFFYSIIECESVLENTLSKRHDLIRLRSTKLAHSSKLSMEAQVNGHVPCAGTIEDLYLSVLDFEYST